MVETQVHAGNEDALKRLVGADVVDDALGAVFEADDRDGSAAVAVLDCGDDIAARGNLAAPLAGRAKASVSGRVHAEANARVELAVPSAPVGRAGAAQAVAKDDERELVLVGREVIADERVGRSAGLAFVSHVRCEAGVALDGEGDARADEPEEGAEDPGLLTEEASVAVCRARNGPLDPGLSTTGRAPVRVRRVDEGDEDGVETEGGLACVLEGGVREGAPPEVGRSGEFEVGGRDGVGPGRGGESSGPEPHSVYTRVSTRACYPETLFLCGKESAAVVVAAFVTSSTLCGRSLSRSFALLQSDACPQ